MTTSLTTFEYDFRQRLLDVIYAQWRDMGVPFSAAHASESTEVIDPEALLWCSLEFFPTEPRLREGVVAWVRSYAHYIIGQRINRLAKADDDRAALWRGMVGPRLRAPAHGRTGKPAPGPSTVILEARDLLGGDTRHVLLVYLLANPAGARLRSIQRWSGYTYRSISQTASRWQEAGALVLDRGYCRLTDAGAWHRLLRHHAKEAVIVDWLSAFDACIGLSRGLARAVGKRLPIDSPIVASCCRQADEALSAAIIGDPRGKAASVAFLRELIHDRSPDNAQELAGAQAE